RIELSQPSTFHGTGNRWSDSPELVRVTRVQPWAKLDAPAFRLDDQEPGEKGNGADPSHSIVSLFHLTDPLASSPGPISVVPAADGRSTVPIERLCRFRC